MIYHVLCEVRAVSDLEYWIWFAGLRRLRSVTRTALLDRFASPKGIWFAEKSELGRIPGITQEELDALAERSTGDIARILRRCEEESVQILTMQDALYPARLRNIPDPPYVLYVKGRLPAVDTEPVIAIVGTRNSTPYGDKMARSIGYEIAARGGIVTTGLAGGIDSRAAEGALMAGGTVIGVLGVAINEVYPRYNTALYADVQASGALISEYPPDAKGSGAWFPQRNRIIAALSLGVVVAEAPLKSGALITAHKALDYGRDVFAVPANADAENSRGCNLLLREGAVLTENGWDVLKEYEALYPERIRRDVSGDVPKEYAVPGRTKAAEQAKAAEKQAEKPAEEPKSPLDMVTRGFLKFRVPSRKQEAEQAAATPLQAQLSGLTEQQLKLVSVMNEPSIHVDDLIAASGLTPAVVLSELTMLQIKGFVVQEPGKRFTLNIRK